ncbi:MULTISPECIES: HK97 family phage prohead protease [unclassified Psychrobacter]|uniref:HK97 family phage prohead protease n=1 Tax=unclassified Psychrobacter TaxID=196806 RepID=UPI00086E443A|nr:HK97 family phage prohead protease [Psychrobacter sp. B29-1]OEH68535.1 MAG: hypothetical protein BAX61_07225 [Psychrobacter sp. B29-1]
MTKAYTTMKVKAVVDDSETRTITGIASTPRLDRDGDTMDMAGAEYTLPFPFMWQHDHCQPVGEVVDVIVTDEQIEVVIEVAIIKDEGDLKKRIDDAWHSLKNRLVKGLSVGFGVKDYQWINDGAGMHIKKWDWYELSAVTVGANPDAVITSVKKIKQAFSDAQNPTPTPLKAAADPVVPATQTKAPSTTSVSITPPSRIITLVDPNQGSVSLISGE